MKQRVWVISGPAGVGKSTTAKKLAETLEKSAYISGDDISHMVVSGREKPWESKQANDLVWKNLIALSENFLNAGYDVVIDWVAFWEETNAYMDCLKKPHLEIRYVMLWADEQVHVQRDEQRPAEKKMGERVLILREEFRDANVPERHIVDNTKQKLNQIVQTIRTSDIYLLPESATGIKL